MTNDQDILVIVLAGESALVLCDLDGKTGGMTLREKVSLPGVEGACLGMPLATNPAGDRVYVAWRGKEKRLFTFALDTAARHLAPLSDAPLPASMCHASPVAGGRHLATASMTDSTIALSPLAPDGTASAPVWSDAAPFAHCLIEAPNGLLYAPSLKGHFVQIYALADDASSLRPVARQDAPDGSGPRHILFTADGATAYLLSEFAGTLTAFDVAPKAGTLTPRQTVSFLSDGEKAKASELCLSPDERVLYASERNTSQIFAYRLEDARMHLMGAFPAPDCPRAIGLDSTGRHLIALGEKSGDAWSYRIDGDGMLVPAARLSVGAGPSWVLAFGPANKSVGAC
ncbi:6-phosphogluconolactonase [Palleronia marisminoris]|uniref:6-phosphogluconolactonase n=1 Tax=Palleronia marisminoris TaxID=315423 RepID=A0A1Y5TW81_9RHOB|nr:beta-propeller fold lactonase family protein [Palleronia marisminoris]SFH49232.1 6-phosphogluconolactonase [Palleronia marisminoris]SLN69879.1 6-phosphogluconolactonase [Palleronia marisminoris]